MWRQPRGFQPERVLATALDPRTKILHGVPTGEVDGVRELVVERETGIMTAKTAKKADAPTASFTPSMKPSTLVNQPKRRHSGQAAVATAYAQGASLSTVSATDALSREQACHLKYELVMSAATSIAVEKSKHGRA